MDGNMRRLPPWMLAGVTDNKTVEVKRKNEPKAPKTKAEKRPRRTVKNPKERDDSDEPKKVGIRTMREKRIRSKIDGKKPEITQSATGPEDEDLTVDDLLSFAQEYVESEGQDRESLSISESMVVMSESNNQRSSQQGTKDPTKEDMLDLLLGPFFKKPQH